jgi:hypothetical protein
VSDVTNTWPLSTLKNTGFTLVLLLNALGHVTDLYKRGQVAARKWCDENGHGVRAANRH